MNSRSNASLIALNRVMELAQQGREADALALCRETLEGQPEQPELLHAAALCSLRLRELGTAEQYARRAISAAADQAHFHNTLANILRESGQPAAAEAAYRRAIELAPGYYDPWYNLVVLHRRCVPRVPRLPASDAAARERVSRA